MPKTAAGQHGDGSAGAARIAAEPAETAGAAGARRGTASQLARAMSSGLRQHWLMVAVLLAGLVLRTLAEVTYRPALIYIDSLKYLYNSWPGTDPVGYKVPLGAILLVGNLEWVTAVQHLLGLGMGTFLYLLLVRRRVPRWLAALAAVPVLLDAYQLQMEQTIMPDVWFEALVVAGLALLLWRDRPGVRMIAAAGLVLGASATMRQVGEILVVPSLIYLLVVVRDGSWRWVIGRCAVLCVSFAVPILGYCTVAYAATGHFQLSRSGVNSTYGRIAGAADCATLRLSPDLRPLCPTGAQQAHGRDWLDHNPGSPLQLYVPPPGLKSSRAASEFDNAVLRQQPLRVATAILSDAAKLFAVTRVTAPGDTPISRWQFQDGYPAFPGYTSLNRQGTIILSLRLQSGGGGPVVYQPIGPSLGGNAAVIRPLAAFLRTYQLHHGYAPGPMWVLALVAGLIGSLARFRRGRPAAERQITGACLLFFTAGVTVLGVSDLFEYSWRYQLSALVMLPPAGALGIAFVIRCIRDLRSRDQAQAAADSPDQASSLAG